MEHSFTDEQRMLKDSVDRMLDERYSFAQRRRIVESEAGHSPEVWQVFADIGLLAIPFDERHGGLGGSCVDTMIVMQALGRKIVVEPYLPTVVLAGGLLRHGGSAAHKATLIPEIVAGRMRLAFAHAEANGRYNPSSVSTIARRSGSAYRLHGQKCVVYGAPMADKLLVTARTGGGERDPIGISVFHVDRKAAGLSFRDYPTIDGMRASELMFDGVEVHSDDIVGELDHGLPLVERVLDEASAAVCAEATGAMTVINDKTLEYARNRVAFGQSISSFQVIQHRLVDMRVACEYAAAMSLMAALKLDAPAPERARAVSAAKSMVGRDSRFVGQSAIQLHGAIGMADELDIGHYFKRITTIGLLFGNSDHHLRRFWREWRGSDTQGQHHASPSEVA